MSLNPMLAFYAGLLASGLGLIAVIRKPHSYAAWFFLGGMMILGAESAFACMSFRVHEVKESAFWLTLALVTMSMIPGVWLCFSLTYSRGNFRQFLKSWRWAIGVAFLLPIGIAIGFREDLVHFAYPDLLGTPASIWFGRAARVLNILVLVATVVILMNLEKTFRASTGTMRWRVKYLFLGLAVIFGAQIYTVSQALLYSEYHPGLLVVKSVALLITCALISIAYVRGGFAELNLYPSRDFLHRSATCVIAGGYLFVVGILAKVVTYLGGSESFPAEAFIVLVGIAGLAVVLLSDRARLSLQRFISRHFKRPQHDFHKIWTRLSQRVSSVPDRDRLCVAAASLISETFDSLSVTIFTVHDGEKALVMSASTTQEQLSGDEADTGMLDLCEIKTALKGVSHPFGLDKLDAAWAKSLCAACPVQFEQDGSRICVPLKSGEQLLGLVVLADRVNGIPYALEELDLLVCIGDQIAAGLLILRLSQEVMRAEELHAFQAMSTFFVHDMKNAASSLNLLLQNLPEQIDNPAFRTDALRAMTKAMGRINHLTGQLSSFREKLTLHPVETDLNEVVESALEHLATALDVELVKELQPVPKISVDPEQIHNVVTNLILNARAAAGRGGRVSVETHQERGCLVLAVEDNGCGMSREFLRDSLFQPFHTTKNEGLGIGMFQSKMIVEAHQGNIQVKSELMKGTTVRVSFPSENSVFLAS